MSNQIADYPRGKAYTSVSAANVGYETTFPDIDWSVTTGVHTRLGGGQVHCKLMKNSSGSALLPAEVVQRDLAVWEKETDAKCGLDERGNGVVDEYLPAAGVPDGSYYWMVFKGNTKLINSSATAIDVADWVTTAASGKVVEDTAPESANDTIGWPIEAVAATADLKFRAYVNFENLY